MANENTHDSGHVILPVLHAGENRIDNIAVPENTPLENLHESLVNSDYHLGDSKQPTADGSLENQEDFKNSVREAIQKAGFYHAPHEAAFTVTNKSRMTPTQTGETIFNEDSKAKTELQEPAGVQNTFGSVHTHPAVGVLGKNWGQGPSAQDVATAKQLKQHVMVVSMAGLFDVAPNGEITQTYKDDKWLNSKKK
jgi:hypothetical protein